MANVLLDLREQVGQLLLMGFEGSVMSARLRSTLASLQPGGVILFARNLESPQQTHALLQECRNCVRQPLLACVDMEGGTVDRLKEVIAPAPSVADVVATGNRRLFRKHGRVLGEECRALGFNADFAPVLDLALAPSRAVLTSRPAAADPRQVVLYAREFLRGLKGAGVLGCGKHFPGLGEANLDTHKELPAIAKPWKRLWAEDLYPYRALKREVAFVMVAHAAYPAVTRQRIPASLSKKWMTGILRGKLGYRGLVLSDDLEMGGVLAAAAIEDAAVGTLCAGADIFMVCHDEDKVWRAYEAALRTAERDRKFARLVAERAGRILAFKQRSRELQRAAPAPTRQVVDRLQRALWELNEEARLEVAARS
jgi:beta-N-acetylhexosaminidase